jgi:hypothetical protein
VRPERLAVLAILALAGCVREGSAAEVDATTGDGSTGATTGTTTAVDCEGLSDDLYTRRIAPLLATDRPKTCNTCHLSGIDLEMFVQDTPCQTMACLETKGLVDLADPASSTILRWISRADPASPLIDQRVIDEEYAAFLAWIEATATCGGCYVGDAPCGTPVQHSCEADDPKTDTYEDPGDCSMLTRETLFRRRVYAWRGRCSPCHLDDNEVDAPKWIATGACELGSLTTMRNVSGRGLVDLDDPAASLLLLKPLAESAGGVKHGGHDKFAGVDDPAYVDFLAWISREAACTP